MLCNGCPMKEVNWIPAENIDDPDRLQEDITRDKPQEEK